MSPSLRRGVRLAAMLLCAAILQGLYADSLQVHGARPDLLLLTAILGSLFCDINGSAALGFFAGLLHAALAAPPNGGFGSLIVSRTLVCLGVGWLEERVFRDNPLIALFLAALGTALAEGLFFLFAPQHHVLRWTHNVGLTTLYNAVLALPLYFLVRRFLHPNAER
ncbi:MAG TPA: rod shape-determining protein MreD [Chthonomonadaceae bacterium]|nr:rod shape-determining protein MreD [Chthonomonadaceae bacterium]